jgi:hypothetical protein
MLLGMLRGFFQRSFILSLNSCCLSHQSVETLFFWFNILAFHLLSLVICKVSCQGLLASLVLPGACYFVIKDKGIDAAGRCSCPVPVTTDIHLSECHPWKTVYYFQGSSLSRIRSSMYMKQLIASPLSLPLNSAYLSYKI